MPIDVKTLSDIRLNNLIANHRSKKATENPIYLDALRENEMRHGRGFDFDKSFAIIRTAAKERRFISYKDLSDASGAQWNQVHYSVGGHLWRLVEYAHRKNWPMLSAIVVNKNNTDTGAMEPETLKGFVAAAKSLGYPVLDDEAFLREQQELVFAWAEVDD